MRSLLVPVVLVALAACHADVAPPAPVQSVQSTAKAAPPRALPRYFPRAPARVTVVATTELGTVATQGPLRLLLREGDALPDSAPYLLVATAAGAESGGTPTGTPAASTIALPERLGGGWLFTVGNELWSAQTWLERPRRLFELTRPPRVQLGTAAIVAQEPGRSPFAFEPGGKLVPLEGWPESPALADLATRDAKHAAVVADLRGLAITEDGGRTWRDIPSGHTPIGVRAAPGGYLVRGRNGADEREVSWRIDVHGDLRGDVTDGEKNAKDAKTRVMPSAAWERLIAHGYDECDVSQTIGAPPGGTCLGRYVVFDHGLLDVYQQSDGARLVHESTGNPEASCRPVRWPGGAQGFACTTPADTTLWRIENGRFDVASRFAGARRVWSTDAGALALEGACENAAAMPGTLAVCVWGPARAPDAGAPTTVRLQGATPDDVIVPLPDGSVVVLRPPHGPRSARRGAEMFVDRPGLASRVQGVPLKPVQPITAEIAEHLAQGHWLHDVSTLPKGELGIWVEHDGRLLGLHAHADGSFELGPRSAAATMHRTAGARSLSWSPTGAAFESTDAGMHYTQIGLPSIAAPASDASKTPPPADAGCSSIGCILPTSLRVGWGADRARTEEPDRAQRIRPAASHGLLDLRCSVTAKVKDLPTPTRAPTHPTAIHRPLMPHVPYSAYGNGPFFGLPSPRTREGQILQGFDAVDLADHRSNTFAGRSYLWGAFSIGSTDPDAGWSWRWYDAQTRTVHSTGAAKPPDEVALNPLQTGMASRSTWSITPSADPRRAVGFVADGTRTLVYGLVEGEAPTPIELDDGGSFGALDSALAASGDRTLLAGAVGDPAGTAVYLARGARAERLARVPRVGVSGKPSPALVALHSDGVRVAVVVEDHEASSRLDQTFYVREVYPGDGAIRRYSLASMQSLQTCTVESPGFEAWTKLDFQADLSLNGVGSGHLQSPTRARLRFGEDGTVCLVEATSDVDYGMAALLEKSAVQQAKADPSAVPVLVGHGTQRYTLSCRTPVVGTRP